MDDTSADEGNRTRYGSDEFMRGKPKWPVYSRHPSNSALDALNSSDDATYQCPASCCINAPVSITPQCSTSTPSSIRK